MPDLISRAAPFAGKTDAPSGHAGGKFRLDLAKLAHSFRSSLAIFFFIAAIFLVWRCLAVGVAKPLPIIVMLFTAMLLTGIGWSARLFSTERKPAVSTARTPLDARHARALPTIDADEPSEPAADVVQQLTLRTTAEGGQELSGWLRMNLLPGQRNGTLHVAFCPPFDRPPLVEAEQVAGPDCRIKVAEAQTYGARLDIKLNALAVGEENVLVSFFAASGATQEK
jgi:hypothetical protein